MAEIGDTYIEKGDYQSAVAIYTEALKRPMPINGQSSAYCHAKRGLAYLNNRDYTEALSDFTKAIDQTAHAGESTQDGDDPALETPQQRRSYAIATDLRETHVFAKWWRAITNLHLAKWAESQQDLVDMARLGINATTEFEEEYGDIASFEHSKDLKLPKEIAELLTK